MKQSANNQTQVILQSYPFPAGYRHKDDAFIEFAIIKNDNGNYLTDQAKTYEMLDSTFELKEPEVIKNIVAAIREFGIKKVGNEFLIELVEWDENLDSEASDVLKEAKYRLYAFVSFLNAMAIFYT